MAFFTTVFLGLVKPLELALKSSILWRLKKHYLYDLVEFPEGDYKLCKTLANAENGVHTCGGGVMPLRNLGTIFLISSLLFNFFPLPLLPPKEKNWGENTRLRLIRCTEPSVHP